MGRAYPLFHTGKLFWSVRLGLFVHYHARNTNSYDFGVNTTVFFPAYAAYHRLPTDRAWLHDIPCQRRTVQTGANLMRFIMPTGMGDNKPPICGGRNGSCGRSLLSLCNRFVVSIPRTSCHSHGCVPFLSLRTALDYAAYCQHLDILCTSIVQIVSYYVVNNYAAWYLLLVNLCWPWYAAYI